MALLLTVPFVRGAFAASSSEYEVKAAFVLNFAKFVDWPARAFQNSQTPITICVLGEDPFGRDLDNMLSGQTIDGRSLVARRITDLPRGGCHILYVSNSEEYRFDRILTALRSMPILTVGEEDEFARAGGMISLVVENRRVRFEINQEAAERAGLKLSSQLLKLALRVRDARKY